MPARIVRDNTDRVLARVRSQEERILAKAAFDIEAQAKVAAPIRTGFLRNSIRAVQVGPRHWRIAAYVFYARFVEVGTTRMRARPFLLPAFDRVRAVLLAALRRIRVRP